MLGGGHRFPLKRSTTSPGNRLDPPLVNRTLKASTTPEAEAPKVEDRQVGLTRTEKPSVHSQAYLC